MEISDVSLFRVKIGWFYINNMADLQQSYPDPETFPRGLHLGSVINDLG